MAKLFGVLICTTFTIQLISAVTWLNPDDRLCLPLDFYPSEERVFSSLAVIPYLDRRYLRDFGLIELAPDNNRRYNDFLSCLWKSRSLQLPDGKIDYDLVTKYVGLGLANQIGGTGPAIKLSTIKAEKLVEECKDLHGWTDGQKVVRLRNCLVPHIQEFQRV